MVKINQQSFNILVKLVGFYVCKIHVLIYGLHYSSRFEKTVEFQILREKNNIAESLSPIMMITDPEQNSKEKHIVKSSW